MNGTITVTDTLALENGETYRMTWRQPVTSVLVTPTDTPGKFGIEHWEGEGRVWGSDYEKVAGAIPAHPTVVCLCGSTRFVEAYQKANLDETLAGRIVLTVGCDTKSDHELFHDMTQEQWGLLKQRLDELHKRKIDLADEILVLNVGGYIGESTRSEIEYARACGKRVRYLESLNLDS